VLAYERDLEQPSMSQRGRNRLGGAAAALGLTLTLGFTGWLPAPTAGATTTTVTAPAKTPPGGEFLSPSGNISCEMDNGYIGLHQVYCQTISPPQSVVLARTGTFKVCKGQQCLGNPAINTPVLAYGHSTASGPFHCLSTTAGVTCTIGGKGFRISRSGIMAVPARSSA
jgi:hypothetical protein